MSMTEISDLVGRLQGDLFPRLAQEVGPLTDKMKLFAAILEMAPLGGFLRTRALSSWVGSGKRSRCFWLSHFLHQTGAHFGGKCSSSGWPGRPLSQRLPLARAFIAKAVLAIPTTARLIERVLSDTTLYRLCAWERLGRVPSDTD